MEKKTELYDEDLEKVSGGSGDSTRKYAIGYTKTRNPEAAVDEEIRVIDFLDPNEKNEIMYKVKFTHTKYTWCGPTGYSEELNYTEGQIDNF